jgi:hypothetical protein
MKHIALAITCALPLAACNSDPEVSAENASAEEVSQKLESATGSGKFVNPGLWRTTMTIEEMSVPGMPPEAAAEMEKMQGRTTSDEKCLTPEDVKRPQEDFFGGEENCRYERFTMGNGKIDAVMNCSEDGATQKMSMAGTYSGDTYNMRMEVQPAGGGENAGMGMKMRIDATRVGECTGEESG